MADVKKLKIDGTNYDVKIPSENVKLMTGYSKGSSTNAITPSDSLNSAIGKLECRADANQANVLYALDKIGTNLFDIASPDSTRTTDVALLDNGGATLSCSNASWTQYYKAIPTNIGQKYKIVAYVDSLTNVSGDQFVIVFRTNNSGGTEYTSFRSITTTGTNEALITASSSNLFVGIYINNSETSKSSSVNLRIMICTEEEWNRLQSFQPYGKSNMDLTTSARYNLKKGVKNLFNRFYQAGSVGSSNSTVVFTINGDGSLVLNGSTTSEVAIFVITETGQWSTNRYFSGNYRLALFDGGNASGTGVYLDCYKSGWANRITCAIGESKSVDDPYIIRVCVPANKTLNNVKIYPFICEAAAWEQSQDYQLPARPNNDLTYLESQDRASLVEVVDSGSKQLLQFNNDTVGALVATVQSDGYTVKITGGESTGRTVTYATVTIKQTGVYALKVDLSGTGASCYLNDATTSTQIKEFYSSTEEYFTLTSGHTYGIRTYRSGANTNATISLLLCTKAAFDVSQKYEPYRPSYENVAFGTQMYGNLTTSIIDTLPFGDTMGYINGSSVIPGISNKYVVIHTYKCTSTGQTKIQVVESTDGKQYFRNYDGSSWSAWIPNARTAVKQVTTDGNQTYLGIIATHSSAARGALTMQFVSNGPSTDGAGIIDVVYYLNNTIANSKVYIRTATTGSVQVKCYQASNKLSLAIIFRAASHWSSVSLIGASCEFYELSNYASTNAVPDGYTEITPENLT